MKTKLLLLLLLFIGLLFVPQVAFASGKPTVILDPGHGGKYGGTAGYSGGWTGYYEKHANMEVSNRLKSELEARGFTVIMTRTGDTHFSSTSTGSDLYTRMKVANNYAAGNNDNSIFISVHHNATSSPTYGGYETYYFNSAYTDWNYPPSTLQLHYSPESQRLAKTTHAAVLATGVKEGRGIVANSLYVTRTANMPSVLLEVGYMSNPTEEKMIKTSTFQQKIAASVAKGVDNFFNVYVVNDSKGQALKHFSSKTDAINYSNKVSGSYVTYKKTGAVVGATAGSTTTSKNVAVYHASVQIPDNMFTNTQDAIDYASGFRNTRVVDRDTGEVIWSNYLTKRYSVMNTSNVAVKTFYQKDKAIEYAEKQSSVYVLDTNTDDILWSNSQYKYKNFIVSSKDKGDMVALYNREEAKTYAANWPNTTVKDKWAGYKVIYENTNTTKYAYSPKNIYSKDRILTAIEVSQQLYPNGFTAGKPKKTVVIATSHEYADALSAGPLAAFYDNAPILLNKPAALSSAVEQELKRLNANHVILVGGTQALSTSVESRLKNLGLSVERLSGSTRYATNEKINDRLPAADGVFAVSGQSYPDALSAGSIAVIKEWPIVLVNNNGELPTSLSTAFGKEIVIVGGTGVVADAVEKKLNDKIGNDLVHRISGASRYDTLSELLDYYNDEFITDQLIVATGTNYPDALVSSALSARLSAPLILVPENGLPANLEKEVQAQSTEKLIRRTNYIGGGISSTIRSSIDGMQK